MHYRFFLYVTLSVILTTARPAALNAEQLVIDAVVASVNSKPITLLEVQERLKKPITLPDLAQKEARGALEALIFEKLLEEDAASRKISVKQEEIDSYIEEVVRRNGITREEFNQALVREGTTLNDYQRRISLEIIRTRIASQIAQASVTIEKPELDRYLAEIQPQHEVAAYDTLQLSRLVIDPTLRSEDEVKARIKEVLSKVNDGTAFSELAKLYSDTADGKEGGALGTFHLTDLNETLRNAVEELDEGDISPPVPTEAGITILFVDKKEHHDATTPSAPNEAQIEEARKKLLEQKTAEKVKKFLLEELPALYAVERKFAKEAL